MRPRGSITAPLILITLGVLFLLQTFSRDFSIADLIARYWPAFLIVWGAVTFVEITLQWLRGRLLPANGLSGFSWFWVVLICFIGLGTREWRHPNNWWREAGWEGSMDMFGNAHDYALPPVEKVVVGTPRIIIEGFRGNARISGSDSATVQLSGHKTIRSADSAEADRTNLATPVELLVNAGTVVIRCNQDHAKGRVRVTTDLDLTVPRNSAVEATGRTGDFDVTNINGRVDIASENAGVRLQNLGSDVNVDTKRGDLVRCNNVHGNVSLRGHGTDVELEKILGRVTIAGDYSGTIALRELAKPARVESLQTKLNLERLPGEIKIERGSLNVENVVGPVGISTRASDIEVHGFTDEINLDVDRGDVELYPATLPLAKMNVHTHSGNIEVSLPSMAHFGMVANTHRGDIENEWGDALNVSSSGKGARLEGGVAGGPELKFNTDRGTITIRKSSGEMPPPRTSDTGDDHEDDHGRLLQHTLKAPPANQVEL